MEKPSSNDVLESFEDLQDEVGFTIAERSLFLALLTAWHKCGRPAVFTQWGSQLMISANLSKNVITRARKGLIEKGVIHIRSEANNKQIPVYSFAALFGEPAPSSVPHSGSQGNDSSLPHSGSQNSSLPYYGTEEAKNDSSLPYYGSINKVSCTSTKIKGGKLTTTSPSYGDKVVVVYPPFSLDLVLKIAAEIEIPESFAQNLFTEISLRKFRDGRGEIIRNPGIYLKRAWDTHRASAARQSKQSPELVSPGASSAPHVWQIEKDLRDAEQRYQKMPYGKKKTDGKTHYQRIKRLREDLTKAIDSENSQEAL